jgi:hypothetical protein
LPEDAGAEQLRIELRNGEIFAQSLALDRECRHDGMPFSHGALAPEATLTLGSAALRVRLTQNADRKHGSKSEGWPPAVRVVGFGAIAVGLYVTLQTKPPVSLLDQAVEHPALFDAPVSACAARGDREIEAHASRLLREANLQSERAPFYPRDGVSAVQRYEEAAACLSQVGRTRDAMTIAQTADALRSSLADQFHVRHVRLERFLSVKKYDAAQREVRVLQDFLNRREGPYAQWLAAVQRELNTRFASTKKG